MENKTIYALGYFDGVHLGHKALLDACREAAKDCQSGAVTFSGHPQQLVCGNAVPLINTDADRRQLLLGTVDTVVELPFTDKLMAMPWQDFLDMLVRDYHAAGFVCGSDFRFGCKGEGTAALLQGYCQSRNLACRIVPQQILDGVRISSTHIRTLLTGGKTREANRFLGHSHILSGQVQSGKQLGRTIGFPTANLPYPDSLLKLPHGVYACRAQVGGKSCNAITNIGTRPTVSGAGITVEAHILDFSGDLYGQMMTLEFLDFIRPERKFDSLSDLQRQISEDLQYFA